ncbi:MAG: aldose 1-epimerase [Polaribacter sp.]|nr:aldose 1-epimerase [Polaribacter sp.]MDP4703899.1 aldose 1-epimerase [Polaribacter sp.]
MYSIQSQNNANAVHLILANAEKTTQVIISLNEGARISSLIVGGKTIIKELPDFSYSDSYAAAILFPFASRIEKGAYQFDGKTYQLDCNQAGINALHGLVYNKTFTVINQKVTDSTAAVTMVYTETNPPKGFPFQYALEVTYTLSENNVGIAIKVTNLDTTPFPFTLGWHPYFYTEHLAESVVKFNSHQQVAFDEKLITKELVLFTNEGDFAIENKQLDDCFVMNDAVIEFETNEYQVTITSDAAQNYLQMFTPPHRMLIAIEPMTGISNSFNNGIGLQVLAPAKTYEINWHLSII